MLSKHEFGGINRSWVNDNAVEKYNMDLCNEKSQFFSKNVYPKLYYTNRVF